MLYNCSKLFFGSAALQLIKGALILEKKKKVKSSKWLAPAFQKNFSSLYFQPLCQLHCCKIREYGSQVKMNKFKNTHLKITH